MRPLVWISDPSLKVPCAGIKARGAAATFVDSAKDLLDVASQQPSISFVDEAGLQALAEIHHVPLPNPIVAITRQSLGSAIGWLAPYPWLAHVVSDSMLEHPMFDEQLEHLISTLSAPEEPRLLDWLGPEVAGRRIRLTHASKRGERLERMSEFLETNGIGSRTSQQLRDVAEELLTNAFYDAPVSAGAMPKPISRTLDVALPEKYACDLAYGFRADLAIVRVRDPFGSLSRRRLVDVLTRCARTDMAVEVDESMGGAGLGIWRVFSNASFVVVSVVKHRHTEILVGIARRTTPRPFAFHLLFRDGARRRFWKLFSDDTSDLGVNRSVLLEVEPK